MRTVLLVYALILIAFTATAQDEYTVLDIIGFLYESDNSPGVIGFEESNSGDVLAGFGFVDNTSDPLEWSPDDYCYTWYMSNLVSTGAVNVGGNIDQIVYTGGTIDIVADAYNNPGYSDPIFGTDPPQGQFLETFTDGQVMLHGIFENFAVTYDNILGIGNYQGMITFELGAWYQNQGYELENPNGFTIAGLVNIDNDSTVPSGFDLSTDGHVYYMSTIPNNDISWGAIKNLFR